MWDKKVKKDWYETQRLRKSKRHLYMKEKAEVQLQHKGGDLSVLQNIWDFITKWLLIIFVAIVTTVAIGTTVAWLIILAIAYFVGGHMFANFFASSCIGIDKYYSSFPIVKSIGWLIFLFIIGPAITTLWSWWYYRDEMDEDH